MRALLLTALLIFATASSAQAQNRRMDRFGTANPRVGSVAPDFECTTDQAGTFKLSEEIREKPVLLFFGSCT